jgi:2-iminoacetate synthase
VPDTAFERIVILYRLCVPPAGVVVSTREPASLRERVLDIGASQISAGSKTDPGGYADGVRRHESEQFEVDDTRSLEEIVRMVLGRGFLPSLCTSCYRRHRTGNTFTEMAVDGHIREFCLPNALLTLAEFATTTRDGALREECLAAVRDGRKDLEGAPLLAEYDRKLALVLDGARDHHF